MHAARHSSVAATLGLLCAIPLFAQHHTYQMYGPAQGLTNPTIIALSQDRQGFLWVSTEGGLFRYDGDRFQQFAAVTAYKKGNTVAMHSSPDGQFWTASTAGLFRWTGDRFQPVPGFQDVELEYGQTLASDSANLYVATPAGLRSVKRPDLERLQRARIPRRGRRYRLDRDSRAPLHNALRSRHASSVANRASNSLQLRGWSSIPPTLHIATA